MEIQNILQALGTLRPMDMSITMLAFAVVDMWAALSLAAKHKTTLSKTLIKGFLFNLIIILLPYGLNLLALVQPTHGSFDYIQFISVFVTILFIAAVSGSIVANYSAAYPKGKNLLTRFAYKYLPSEILEKQNKHGIRVNDDDVDETEAGKNDE